MHLLGPAFTTTKYGKTKSKVKINDKLYADWKNHNKCMKQSGAQIMSFNEYVLYRQGKYKAPLKGTPLPDYNVSNHRKLYPSGVGIGVSCAKPIKEYTGSLIKGISVMHKSNAVPVINKEQILEIATMRRG